jgi:hypothetical protein
MDRNWFLSLTLQSMAPAGASTEIELQNATLWQNAAARARRAAALDGRTARA